MVMTGGTSGFGALAAQRVASSGRTRLILGGRRAATVGEVLHLDLSVLDSVRGFADSVRERLDGSLIDSLVLNGGVILPDISGRTIDGFETAFAVNHLAHYLLVRLLLPALADEGTMVLTTSGTHDPATGSGLATPRHADAILLAHPDRDPHQDAKPRTAGQHAYTASKLCAVLTARHLSSQPEVRARRVNVIAYDPGQVFGTGLANRLSFPMRTAWRLFGGPLGAPLRRLNPTMSSQAAAARTLADLALGVTATDGQTYSALRGGRLTFPDPSELARSDELASSLWDDSARLVGLAPSAP